MPYRVQPQCEEHSSLTPRVARSLQTLCLGSFGQVCRETHVVAAGDTCGSIAAGAGTTVDLVLANNPNVDKHCLNIYPGEVCAVGLILRRVPAQEAASAYCSFVVVSPPQVLCTADFVVPASGSSAANLNTAASSICAPRCCNFVCQP